MYSEARLKWHHRDSRNAHCNRDDTKSGKSPLALGDRDKRIWRYMWAETLSGRHYKRAWLYNLWTTKHLLVANNLNAVEKKKWFFRWSRHNLRKNAYTSLLETTEKKTVIPTLKKNTYWLRWDVTALTSNSHSPCANLCFIFKYQLCCLKSDFNLISAYITNRKTQDNLLLSWKPL